MPNSRDICPIIIQEGADIKIYHVMVEASCSVNCARLTCNLSLRNLRNRNTQLISICATAQYFVLLYSQQGAQKLIFDVMLITSEQEDGLQSNETTDDETCLEESAANSNDPESYLSTHSSYANVSMADGQSLPSETVNQVTIIKSCCFILRGLLVLNNLDCAFQV